MTTFLPYFVVIMLLVVGLGFFNEKITGLTDEIALMLFSIAVGGILLLYRCFFANADVQLILDDIQRFDLEDYLMDCVLCFMLFAGSCHMKLRDFGRLARPVALLSFLCTLLGAVIYGVAFFLAGKLLSLSFSLAGCLMFGAIVAPTDPIAATSILKKFGLPKDTSFLIESESLFNDGVGVALFVCFSGMVKASENESVLIVMCREVLGAALVGIVVSAICLFVFANTKNNNRQIFSSLLAVSTAYLLCEHFDFSGAIASVVCGIMYSHFSTSSVDTQIFNGFWGVLDDFLNSVLYVMLGLSFIKVLTMPIVMALSAVAIICNFIGRFSSVGITTLFFKEMPDGYSRLNFSKLLTWAGLRGGLCIALAMSTNSILSDDSYRILLGGTYGIVFFTTVVQGLTMRKVYEKIQKS